MKGVLAEPGLTAGGPKKYANMKISPKNLNAVGELFAVLANKRSFHCVLQMPAKELLIAIFVVIAIIVVIVLIVIIKSNTRRYLFQW